MSNALDNLIIVLVATTDSGNIGGAARAMKTMGISQLRLVNPQCHIDAKAIARASGAEDILQNAKHCKTLEEAIADTQLVFGTSARKRDLEWPLLNPEESGLAFEREGSPPTAIIFGREHAGLTNEELQHCHYHICIPTNPDFASLNLAASVQVLSYVFRVKTLITDITPTKSSLPSQTALNNFYGHLEKALISIDFLDPKNPKKALPRLRRFFARSLIQAEELDLFRGIFKKILRASTEESNS